MALNSIRMTNNLTLLTTRLAGLVTYLLSQNREILTLYIDVLD